MCDLKVRSQFTPKMVREVLELCMGISRVCLFVFSSVVDILKIVWYLIVLSYNFKFSSRSTQSLQRMISI
jgi:hypothetical protein